MKEIILRLMSLGYDVFIPINSTDEVVFSSSFGTKRAMYRQASIDSKRSNYYIQNSSSIVSEAAVKLDGVISCTPKGLFFVPIRDALNKRIIRINSDMYVMLRVDSTEENRSTVEDLVRMAISENTTAEAESANTNYFESILNNSPDISYLKDNNNYKKR